jgi:trehalose monomycolate/heme transporter
MLKIYGQFIYRQRLRVLIGGVILALVAGIYGLGISDSLKAGGMVNPAAESERVAQILQSEFGQDQGLLLVMFKSKNNLAMDEPIVKQAVLEALAKLPELKVTGKIITYYSTNDKRFISDDKQYTLALVGLTGDSEDANVQAVKKLQPVLTHPDLVIKLGGKPAVSYDLTNQIKQDLIRAELLTFPVVGILLIIIFRSVIAALLPLLVGAITIFGAFALLRLITNFIEISTFSLSLITMLGLGLAIDYSLFMVSRFREELRQNKGDKALAIVKTLETAGHTVIFSGLTVIICLLSLLVFPSMFFRSMGFGAAVAVLVAVITSLTILPVILMFMGEGVNKGAIKLPFRKAATTGQTNVWHKVGRLISRRPVIVLVVTLVPLVWAGLPFFRAEFAMFDVRSLPSQQASRTVNDVLISRFDYKAFTPLQVVIRSDRPVLAAENLAKLPAVLAELKKLPGVKKVESLFDLNPNPAKTAYSQFFAPENLDNNPKLSEATKLYANGNTFLVKIYFDGEAYAKAAKNLVAEVRQLNLADGFSLNTVQIRVDRGSLTVKDRGSLGIPPSPQPVTSSPTRGEGVNPAYLNGIGFSLQVGGEAAYLVDFLNGLGDAIPLALVLVMVAMFVLLYVMLGSVVVPLKALVLNFLSLSVSFGALVWIFQEGNLAGLFQFNSFGTIDGSMPVLLFALSFGLSMDYEVFLLSRIKEEYDRTGDTSKAIVSGLHNTGAIITGAALTLVVVVAALAFTEVSFVKQVGVGLAIAILVDATIVRMLLLPASMQLMGKYNWWSPRFLKRSVKSSATTLTKPVKEV